MASKLFSTIFCLASIFSCSNGEEGSSNTKADPVKSDSQAAQRAKAAIYDSPPGKESAHNEIKITDITSVQVLSAKKEFDSTSKFFNKFKDKCDAWTLSKNDIENIIRTSTPIDGHEFHYYYDILPCYYGGEANINGRLIKFKVNAGASTTLIVKDSSAYLGYKKNDYKKYFLLGPGID